MRFWIRPYPLNGRGRWGRIVAGPTERSPRSDEIVSVIRRKLARPDAPRWGRRGPTWCPWMPPRMRVLVKGPFVSAPYDARKQRRLRDYGSRILRYGKGNKRVEVTIWLSKTVKCKTGGCRAANDFSDCGNLFSLLYPAGNYFSL